MMRRNNYWKKSGSVMHGSLCHVYWRGAARVLGARMMTLEQHRRDPAADAVLLVLCAVVLLRDDDVAVVLVPDALADLLVDRALVPYAAVPHTQATRATAT